MLNQYKDMLAKAKFYKKKVLQSFIKQGYFPSNEEIETALSDIDTRSALLETWLSAKGSLFNTKEINYMFECIYNICVLVGFCQHLLQCVQDCCYETFLVGVIPLACCGCNHSTSL